METTSTTIRPRRPFHRRRRATTQSAPTPPPPVEDVLTGTILPYGGETVPEGYLDCDGAAVSRAEYAALFAVVGTAYGPGDGATTFNLPDFRGRTLLGAGTGAGLSPRSRGDSGGAERVQLSPAELPPHDHPYSQAIGVSWETGEVQSGSLGSSITSITLDTQAADTGVQGGHEPHENLPPFGVVRWIVKA